MARKEYIPVMRGTDGGIDKMYTIDQFRDLITGGYNISDIDDVVSIALNALEQDTSDMSKVLVIAVGALNARINELQTQINQIKAKL